MPLQNYAQDCLMGRLPNGEGALGLSRLQASATYSPSLTQESCSSGCATQHAGAMVQSIWHAELYGVISCSQIV